MATCPKCKREIDLNYIKHNKTNEGVKCPSCRSWLEESKKTQYIVLGLAIVPMIGFSMWIDNSILKLALIFGWAFLCSTLIRPVIAKYTVREKE